MASARENAAEIIAALMKSDCTAPELAEYVGCHVRTIAEWLEAFHQSGLIRRVHGRSIAATWAWQDRPFELEDEIK